MSTLTLGVCTTEYIVTPNITESGTFRISFVSQTYLVSQNKVYTFNEP